MRSTSNRGKRNLRRTRADDIRKLRKIMPGSPLGVAGVQGSRSLSHDSAHSLNGQHHSLLVEVATCSNTLHLYRPRLVPAQYGKCLALQTVNFRVRRSFPCPYPAKREKNLSRHSGSTMFGSPTGWNFCDPCSFFNCLQVVVDYGGFGSSWVTHKGSSGISTCVHSIRSEEVHESRPWCPG